MTAKLVLLRHGFSEWNKENRFTGWTDVDLAPEGIAEAKEAARLLKQAGLGFDVAYTSVLKRAIRTLWVVQDELDLMWIPVHKDWRLNERHYGGLTGLNKAQTAEIHGAAQVMIWRRSYDVAPPPLAPGGPYDFAADRRYTGVTPPATESLKTTLERVLPYWNTAIAPALSAGERLLVAAHGNSIRAIVKNLYAMSEEDIIRLEIPTGNPMLVDLGDDLRPAGARYLDPSRAEPLPSPA
jgi:2,3-bisphosphoglycerate-dependent phosphoglycerate mutase